MSSTRKEEIKQAILATRYITLQILGRSFDDCFLNLDIGGMDGGFRIKELLF